MSQTTAERRIYAEHEHAREMEETGERAGDVSCAECSGDFNAEDGGAILLGLAVCGDCALPAALRERLAEGWSERPLRERLDILDVIAEAAQAEERELRQSMRVRRAG